MHKHNQWNCKHESVKYCVSCNLAYCEKCNQEFSKKCSTITGCNWFGTTIPTVTATYPPDYFSNGNYTNQQFAEDFAKLHGVNVC